MAIEHVFVLMLENRSFDHMLGFSGLTGVDAATGQTTAIGGLTGRESNVFNGTTFTVNHPASTPLQTDPRHEFSDVVEQLCGLGTTYQPHTSYPPINMSGFSASYGTYLGQHQAVGQPGDVMQGFDTSQLPVLNFLASEFAVCDAWHSSMPGPTWPNRFFAMAGSSGGLDDSPTGLEMGIWQTLWGFRFRNGSLFNQSIKWRIYSGNVLTAIAHALRGVHIRDIRRYRHFAGDLNTGSYDAQFTWLEPDYGRIWADFVGGNSQHPCDGVHGGEALLKHTYEAIRQSPIWETSLLIVTWDEHGGFYDHVAPPEAVPPGDTSPSLNRRGFDFDQYGARVPAVVISPCVPRNLIDHRVYDHSSIPATVERVFGLRPLTDRDRNARDVTGLVSLPSARETPLEAPNPAVDGELVLDTLEMPSPPATRGDQAIADEGSSLPGFLFLASRAHIQLRPTQVVRTLLRRNGIRTRQQARDYWEEIRQIVASSRSTAGV